jgi:hypothetical protein
MACAVIGLELAFMRILSLRFWYYFAAMVLGVALLGFGCSGTLLTIFQKRIKPRRRLWLATLAYSSGLAALISAWAVQLIPLDIHFLAWSIEAEWLHILEVQLLMLLPFLLMGGFLGLVLMEQPQLIPGHYAANLAGSGAGALLAVWLMNWLSIPRLVVLLAFMCCGAYLCLVDWSKRRRLLAVLGLAILYALAAHALPHEVRVSPYKKLAQELSKPGSKLALRLEGPQGRIDLVKGPGIHDAPPGMSLQNPHPLPPRSLLIIDGGKPHILYHCETKEDWAFLNYTTSALPFFLSSPGRVLVAGPGGGAPLALADMHGSREITALAADRRMVELLRGPLSGSGGAVFNLKQVRIRFEHPRSYLRRSGQSADLILIPLLDPGGGGAGGLLAAQENYLYTLESLEAIMHGLSPRGLFCATVRSKTPPRDGLRLFNAAAQVLRRMGLDPAGRLALIRSWETVTLLASPSSFSNGQLGQIRSFCKSRGFDLAYQPGIKEHETNHFHQLPAPFYHQGAMALLGGGRQQFIDRYLFNLAAPSDNRPFFNNFILWTKLPEFSRQLKGRLPAFLELGSLLLALALIQVALLAAVLIVLPLVARKKALKAAPRKGAAMGYFLLLGLGFMFLEMGFLHKLILYLAQPIYSAAAVIASFLIFAGLGSRLCLVWKTPPTKVARLAAAAVTGLGLIYLLGMDQWLALTHSWSLAARFLIAGLTIAPLAMGMGHLFPLAMARLTTAAPGLAPWAWSLNGFASVLATVSAPLWAMSWGFFSLIGAALICYGLTGVLFNRLPSAGGRAGI